MCTIPRGYHCYFPSCGISALENHREGGKPALFGAYLYADDSPIANRAILCAAHLQIIRDQNAIVHYQPLPEFLNTENSKFTLGLVAEKMEDIMNLRSRAHQKRSPRMVA